ncbi:MAG: hypothetical protein IPN69_08585 [Acidobacteria bacterium]|nr:hypothetical protein [Acidobacteriota bacterium]
MITAADDLFLAGVFAGDFCLTSTASLAALAGALDWIGWLLVFHIDSFEQV